MLGCLWMIDDFWEGGSVVTWEEGEYKSTMNPSKVAVTVVCGFTFIHAVPLLENDGCGDQPGPNESDTDTIPLPTLGPCQ